MGSAPGNADRRAPCYGVADLRIGASIDVHGRIFFLHDCDDFTRRCALRTEPVSSCCACPAALCGLHVSACIKGVLCLQVLPGRDGAVGWRNGAHQRR